MAIKTEHIIVRISSLKKSQIEAAANEAQENVSEWCRKAIDMRLEKGNSNSTFENFEVFERVLTRKVTDMEFILKEEREKLTEEEIADYRKFAFELMQIVNDSRYRNNRLGLALEEILRLTRELEGK